MTDPTVQQQASSVAGTVATVDEAVMKFLPFISTIVAFVPGAQVVTPFMPLITELLATLDNAAKAVASNNDAAAVTDVINEVKNHLTPGAPNSPALS